MSILVNKPGLLSSVQDGGRHGLQHLGVVPCGAMDGIALAFANALVGNTAGEAALEVTVLGPELLFEEGALVALCGAAFDARLNGAMLPLDRPVLLSKGDRLHVVRAVLGSRAYLAVAGGIATAPVLGSRSTYVPARFGGLEGRALRMGDRLPVAKDAARLAATRYARLQSKKVFDGAIRSVAWSVPALTRP